MTTEYSKYQLDFFREVDNGRDNIALNSVAGSGKTFTSVESVNRIPTIYSAQFCAFGKDIAAILKPKIQRRNTTINTYNSFGWQVVLRQAKHKPSFEQDKTEMILQHMILQAKEEDERSWRQFLRFKAPVKRLVSLLKGRCVYTVQDCISHIPELINHYRILTPDDYDFEETVARTFKTCIENEMVYDYDDQIYQPLRQKMLIPAFDFVYVDEYQDSNDMQANLMLQASRNGRFIGIGDPDQAIYGFRGSTPAIFQKLVTDFNAKEMFLSICYRCPKAVVLEAKKIVPRIEAAPWARNGVVDTISTPQFRSMVRPGDFVLCRTVAPLVASCLGFMQEGIPSKVVGRQFGDELEYLIEKVCKGAMLMAITSFRDELGEYVMRKMESFNKHNLQNLAIDLKDKMDSLHAFMVGCKDVADVRRKIDKVFTDENGIFISHMSGHKSKGLECDRNVFIIRPDLLPHPRSKGVSWMEEEERRLQYVMTTRTKDGLFWVKPEKGER